MSLKSAGKAELILGDKKYSLPVVEGTQGEQALDISKLRKETGFITLDSSYVNTGSCESRITFIDGDRGILRHRGIPIETLAEKSTFLETAYLLIFGKLPSEKEYDSFTNRITRHSLIHEDMKNLFKGFPTRALPMSVLSSMVSALSSYYPDSLVMDEEKTDLQIIRLLSKISTIAAFSYKKNIGQPYINPKNNLSYVENLLHMFFEVPAEPYEADPVAVEALEKILILHEDHEQNCSTSTVRMVGSSRANLYAAISSGICALWGPLHGGANQAVVEMLARIQQEGGDVEAFIRRVKDREEKLMGFGHRVYKNFDPRAHVLKQYCDKVLDKLGGDTELFEIARKLENTALNDDFFKERKLYPNVDFYSGIIFRAIGIPLNMFPVMFAIGRLPGWIAQWREMTHDAALRIYRPRQIYTGPKEAAYVPIEER